MFWVTFDFQTAWSDLDYLVIDMPPGTGDIHLSIAQTLSVSGAVIVTTPQKVALIDAVKAVSMFRKVDIPIVGLIENMSSFVCGKCQEETHIFGQGEVQSVVKELNVSVLGSVPLEPEVMSAADSGSPIILSSKKTIAQERYNSIAEQVISKLS